MTTERPVTNTGDLLNLLDRLLQRADDAWSNNLFADREKPCPFFVDWPDEILVADFAAGLIQLGKVLELGCGNGRNATYMASLGCIVDAVDFSSAAIDWAKQRTQAAGLPVNYIHKSIFELEVPSESYDVVYDSGCFHHIPPIAGRVMLSW